MLYFFTEASSLSFITKRIICQGENLDISCPTSYQLKIISATYGRQNTETCITGSNNDQSLQTLCEVYNADNLVKAYCDGYQGCFVVADDATFGNGCDQVSSYLNVTYQCNS